MQLPKDGFHGIGAYIALIPAGKSRGLHSVQFCQAWRRYIESLPLVLKDKRSCFSRSEWSAVQLSLDCVFALQKYIVTMQIHLLNSCVYCSDLKYSLLLSLGYLGASQADCNLLYINFVSICHCSLYICLLC